MKRSQNDGEHAIHFLKNLTHTSNRIEVDIGDKARGLIEGLGYGVRIVKETAAKGNKVIFIGNGGSAAIASHMALDFWNAGKISAAAFNDPAQLTCMANDRGYENVFAEPLRNMGRKGDLLVAISSSGKSPNILHAAKTAEEIGCRIVTLSGFDRANSLRTRGLLNFYVPSTSYGIVEALHLSLLVSILEEIMSSRKGRNVFQRASSSRLAIPWKKKISRVQSS